MSDPSLNAQLELSIDAALSEIDRLAAALDDITTVDITADAADVTSATEAAIDTADTEADVTGDAADVTSATESAVDAADTEAEVTGDAAEVTASTEAAVDQADTQAEVTGDGSELTASTEAAVDQADTQAHVTGDAGELTATTESAVDAADTTAQVTGDASDVTSSTEAAVDNADTSATVTADASDVTGATEAALARADTTIRVTLDSGAASAIASELSGALREVESQSRRTTNEIQSGFGGIRANARSVAGVLTGVLGGAFIGVGARYQTLIQTSQAAFTAVLGDAREAERVLGNLMDFAQGSPFPRQAFIEATQILLSFGFEADQAVGSLQAIQDAVAATGQGAEAINEIALILGQVNSMGRMGADTFNQLGYRGINAAQLIAEQMGTTEAAIRQMTQRGTLDAHEALDALIVGMEENFAGAAEGVAQTWAGATDRIKAALRDLSAAMVASFISPQGGGAAVDFANNLADALRQLEAGVEPLIHSMGGNLAPLLESIGQDLLPALVDSAIALAPLLGSTGVGFQAMVPPLQLLSSLISAIPAPVLQAASAFMLLRSVAGTDFISKTVVPGIQRMGSAAVSAGLSVASLGEQSRLVGTRMAVTSAASRGMGAAVSGLAGMITPANVAMGALAVGAMLLAQHQQNAAEKAAEQRARVDALRQAMLEADNAATGLQMGLEALAADGDDSAQSMSAAGLSAQELTTILLASTDTTDALANAVDQAGIASRDFTDQLRDGNSVSQAYKLYVDDLTDAHGDASREIPGHVRAIRDLIEAQEEAVLVEAAAAFASGEITAATYEEITAADNATAAWANYSAELTRTRDSQERAAESAARTAHANGEITGEQLRQILAAESAAEANSLLADAQERTRDTAELAREVLAEWRLSTGETADAMVEFGNALYDLDRLLHLTQGSASTAGQEFISMDLALASLGVELDGFGSIATAVDDFLIRLALSMDAAGISGEQLEEVAVGLSEHMSGAGINAQDLENYIGAVTDAMGEMHDQVVGNAPTISDHLGELDDITFSGIVDSVEDANDALQQWLDDIEALAVVPSVQAMALREGPEVARVLAAELESAGVEGLSGLEDGLAQNEHLMGTTHDLAYEMGTELARGFAEALGLELDLVPPMQEKLGDMGDALSDAAINSLEPEARIAGLRTTEGIKTGLAGMPGEAEQATAGAIRMVRQSDGTFRQVGGQVGGSGTQGLKTGLAPMTTEASSATDSAIRSLRSRDGSMRSGGSQVGQAGSQGLESGMKDMPSKSRSAIQAAINAINDVKGTAFSGGSGVGSEVGSGMASGIRGKEGEVRAAAASLASAAVSSSKGVLNIASPSRIFFEIGEQIGEGLADGMDAETAAVEAAAARLAEATRFDLPPTPAFDVDPRIAGLAGGGDGFGGMVVNVEPGAVVIHLPPGVTGPEARELGDRAASGFLDKLSGRSIRFAARTA